MKNQKIVIFFILILISGLFRSITWNENFLNIDELEWLYLMRRVTINPLPFQGFTAHTSGPLAIYLLSITNLFEGIPPLIRLRLFQFFICILPTFIFIYKSTSLQGKIFSVFFFFLLIITSENGLTLQSKVDDFFAYNTEYQIMLFMALIYYLQVNTNPKNTQVFFVTFFSITLFFIKSQAVVFIPYFLFIYFIQILIYQSFKLWFYLFSIGIVVSLFLVIIKFLGVWDDFIYEYLYHNFLYSRINSLSVMSQISNISIVWFQSLTFFWYLLLTLIVFGISRWFREKEVPIAANNLIKSTLLLGYCMLVVFISSNNFTHYKVILFFAMCIFSGEVYHNFIYSSNKVTIATIGFVSALYILTYKSIALEVARAVKNQRIAIYKAGIGENPILSPPSFWLKNVKLNVDERKALIAFISNQFKNDSSPKKIFVFGWFIGMGIYYPFLDKISPVSRAANTEPLTKMFLIGDMENYLKKEEHLISDLKEGRPKLIVDSERVLEQLKNQKISKYIEQNYSLAYKSDNFLVFKIR